MNNIYLKQINTTIKCTSLLISCDNIDIYLGRSLKYIPLPLSFSKLE